jgi:hypothetical protein
MIAQLNVAFFFHDLGGIEPIGRFSVLTEFSFANQRIDRDLNANNFFEHVCNIV